MKILKSIKVKACLRNKEAYSNIKSYILIIWVPAQYQILRVTLHRLLLWDYEDLTPSKEKHVYSATALTSEHTSIRSEKQLR